MIYILSDIHGAYLPFQKMKEKLNFGPNDTMYILGDIFDGHKQTPRNCLRILDDVMNTPNIHMIQGNHEAAHVASFQYDDFDVEGLRDPIFGGGPLYDLLRSGKIPKEKVIDYIDYLDTLPLLDGFMCGDKFFCLSHASIPIEPQNEDEFISPLLISMHIYWRNYTEDIIRAFRIFGEEVPTSNIISITGHTPVKYHFDEVPNYKYAMYGERADYIEKLQVPIITPKNICVDCGCRGSSLGTSFGGWKSNLVALAINENTGDISIISYYNFPLQRYCLMSNN